MIADVTKLADLENLVNQTIKTFGKIDILVNNAGIFVPKPFGDDDFIKGLDNTIDIDVRAALQLTRLAVPHLKKTNGTIINTASIFVEVPVSSNINDIYQLY